MSDATLARVVLVAVPVEVYVRIQRHIDELVRELQVIDVGGDNQRKANPPELRDIMTRILTDYAGARAESWQQAAEAMALGLERVDVVMNVPIEAAEAATEWNSLMERANALCREGVLLALPEDDDVAELRRWMIQEIAAQLRGGKLPERCPI